jgi:hypothetical protein
VQKNLRPWREYRVNPHRRESEMAKLRSPPLRHAARFSSGAAAWFGHFLGTDCRWYAKSYGPMPMPLGSESTRFFEASEKTSRTACK